MKKFLTAISTFIAILACCLFAACNKNTTVDPVVIKADSAVFEYNDKTLKDYMDFLQGEGELTYTIADGMVTAINGKSNTTKSFWMLYTDDSENANSTWGTFEYESVTYGSATLGAEALAVKEGCTYIWAYQTF